MTDQKPLGMSGVAWRGCGCSSCRGERKRYLGRENIEPDQSRLTGYTDE